MEIKPLICKDCGSEMLQQGEESGYRIWICLRCHNNIKKGDNVFEKMKNKKRDFKVRDTILPNSKYKRVYVAGAYSANNIIDCLKNIHIGTNKCVKILKNGKKQKPMIVPFCPWLDFMFQFYDKNMQIEDYYNYSMAWLEVSDEVWVCSSCKKLKQK